MIIYSSDSSEPERPPKKTERRGGKRYVIKNPEERAEKNKGKMGKSAKYTS